MELKLCPECEQEKELSEYHTKINTNGSIYYFRLCKVCYNARALQWKKDNPEKHAANRVTFEAKPERIEYLVKNGERQRETGYSLDWRRKNPEKLKIYNSLHRDHDITKAEEESMLKVFDYSCAYCGMTLKEHKKKFKQKLHNDHVDEDGYNDLRNDAPACKSCNCSKHEHEMEEWYFKQKFFDEIKYNKIIWWITEGYKEYIENKPPYRIVRKQNEGLTTYHFQLWTVDIYRNMIECIEVRPTKKELIKDMENGKIKTPEIVNTECLDIVNF